MALVAARQNKKRFDLRNCTSTKPGVFDILVNYHCNQNVGQVQWKETPVFPLVFFGLPKGSHLKFYVIIDKKIDVR